MREISTTVTCGVGSEIHNHDLEYRSTLEHVQMAKHVHNMPSDVIEIIPYIDYRTQINALAKPYIDEYNRGVDARYQAAWDRYNAGETKTKPRKRDYPKMGYDYYADHINDTYYNRKTGKHEELPMFRSLIVGLGDQADRLEGKITAEEAVEVITKLVERFRKDFPHFHLLGAAIHMDEDGFYHCHIDYKPMVRHENTRGLNVNIGQEFALEAMGCEPEQSIINGRDKVPLRFNAFRNKIYRAAEAELAEVGIRLQYGVSAIKEPGKDSGTNQKLEDWQAVQDASRDMQHQKNLALEILTKDEVTPDELKEICEAADKIEQITDQMEGIRRKRFRKDKVEVDYGLFDQLREFLRPMFAIVATLRRKVDELTAKLDAMKDYEAIKRERDELKVRVTELSKKPSLEGRIARIERAKDDLQRQDKDR